MRKGKTEKLSGYTILLVDDNAEYLEATRILLEHEGHEVVCAVNGHEALDILRQRPIDLTLLDYYMPGITGEEVVSRLRQFNPYIQVILQTGYASEQPPRELLRRLDIQGYCDKNEGPEKLLMWTDAGLKSVRTMQSLNKSRLGLHYILDTTPTLHRIQSLSELLNGILIQVDGLLGAVNSFVAVLPHDGSGEARFESFVATIEEDMEPVIRAGTGRFDGQKDLRSLDEAKLALIHEALMETRIKVQEKTTVVPLRVGEVTLGLIYLDRPALLAEDLELLHIFANQAAVAIHNTQLYSMATLDSLTGAFARGFFDKWLFRELRSALRTKEPLALLMVDLNAMKRINDTAGHIGGDQALMTVGKALRQASRATDIVGRYGGDEFALVLPQSETEGADAVASRILKLLEGKTVATPGGSLPISVSIGLSILQAPPFGLAEIPRQLTQVYFQGIAQDLIKNADEALYCAKRDEKLRFRHGEPTRWLSADASDQLPSGET